MSRYLEGKPEAGKRYLTMFAMLNHPFSRGSIVSAFLSALPQGAAKFDQEISSMQEAQTRVSIPKSIPIISRATLVRFCRDIIKTMG